MSSFEPACEVEKIEVNTNANTPLLAQGMLLSLIKKEPERKTLEELKEKWTTFFCQGTKEGVRYWCKSLPTGLWKQENERTQTSICAEHVLLDFHSPYTVPVLCVFCGDATIRCIDELCGDIPLEREDKTISKLFVVMPWMEENLEQSMAKKPLSQAERARVFLELLYALRDLIRAGMQCHQDIKTAQCMVWRGDDGSRHIKLSDFTTSIWEHRNDLFAPPPEECRGFHTPGWTFGEAMRNKIQAQVPGSVLLDLYAVGVFLEQLYKGEMPPRLQALANNCKCVGLPEGDILQRNEDWNKTRATRGQRIQFVVDRFRDYLAQEHTPLRPCELVPQEMESADAPGACLFTERRFCLISDDGRKSVPAYRDIYLQPGRTSVLLAAPEPVLAYHGLDGVSRLFAPEGEWALELGVKCEPRAVLHVTAEPA